MGDLGISGVFREVETLCGGRASGTSRVSSQMEMLRANKVVVMAGRTISGK